MDFESQDGMLQMGRHQQPRISKQTQRRLHNSARSVLSPLEGRDLSSRSFFSFFFFFSLSFRSMYFRFLEKSTHRKLEVFDALRNAGGRADHSLLPAHAAVPRQVRVHLPVQLAAAPRVLSNTLFIVCTWGSWKNHHSLMLEWRTYAEHSSRVRYNRHMFFAKIS